MSAAPCPGAGQGEAVSGSAPANAPAGILSNQRIARGVHWLELAVPDAWGPPVPGQFVTLTPEPAWDDRVAGDAGLALLARPFSVAAFEAEGLRRRLGILYAPIGKVTRRLSELLPGGTLGLLGPLGTGFPLEGERPVWLVAGGRGIAPLLFLSQELKRRGRACSWFYGARSANELVPLPGIPEGEVRYATEDGSCGWHGTVCDLLATCETGALPSVMACGPRGMLAALARWAAERAIDCWVSVEETFGCGTGLCGGCALPATGDDPRYLWACRDGPVLRAAQIAWRAWRTNGARCGCT